MSERIVVGYSFSENEKMADEHGANLNRPLEVPWHCNHGLLRARTVLIMASHSPNLRYG